MRRATPPPTPSTAGETRTRLLDAAGEVFAERGFRAATVREICQRAGANVAAVNYHFGDKERLYAAVFAHTHRASLERYPPDLGVAAGAGAEERLRAFIRALLLRALDEGRPAWHGQLMLREMVEPSPVLDSVVKTAVRPLFDALRGIVRELMGPKADERRITLVAFSIVGQCLFHRHCRAVIARLVPDQRYGPKDVDDLAEHVTRFSLGAIRGARGAGSGVRP